MAKIKPNIVLITTQASGRLFGCYGAKTVNTPSVDKLAAEGALFSGFFASSSNASPSMGAALTGRHPQSNGLMGQCEEPWNWEMNDGEVHLAQLLRLEGYSTTLFRLQDETSKENWKKLGFDEYRAREMSSNELNVDPTKVWGAIRVAKELTGFFGEKAKRPAPRKPFYAQIGLFETRKPFDYGNVKHDKEKGVDVPPWITPNDEARNQTSLLQGAVNQVDKGIDLIMAGLKRCGLDNDTLVIFTSSHGPDLIRDKGTLYDSGIAVPLIMRWPGGIKPGTRCEQLASSIDFLPTILEMIDGDMPFNLEGKSLAKAVTEGSQEKVNEEIFGIYTDSRYVRNADFKLIANLIQVSQPQAPADISKPDAKAPMPVFELFDLKADPNEMANLAGSPSHAQILKTLRIKLVDWMQKVNDPILKKVYPTDYFKKAIVQLLAK